MANKYNTITLEKSESIATITLNRPERLNAINIELGYEFLDALNDCEMDDNVRCIILTGTGRSFCAGDDLGFEPQVRSILGQVRPDKQALLFSAMLRLPEAMPMAEDLILQWGQISV